MRILKFEIALLVLAIVSPVVFGQYNFTQPDFFRKQRQLPLIELDTKKQIEMADFGAIPDDGEDDLKAFLTALKKAKSKASEYTAVEIVFEKGRYDLFAKTSGTHAINFEDAQNIVINGNGAEVVIRNPECGFFKLMRCKNVIIKDLFIDYDPLPFTQGTIIALDTQNKTFDLKIDEGFPNLSESYFARAGQNWGMLMDKEVPGKLKSGVGHLYPNKGWKEIEEGVFRIQLPPSKLINDMEVGDIFVQIARNNGKTIFTSFNGENITYLNVTSYTSPAGSYAAFAQKEWNIIGCRIMLKEGRYHSANADCIHVSGSFFGPWVENCLFEGYSDDAVNLKSDKRYVLDKISHTELVLKGHVKSGEIIRFFNPREGMLLGQAMILKVKDIGSNKFQVSLSQAIEGITKTGADKRCDIAYLDTRACESFVFRNNTLRNARRYGMLLQSCYGIIENNIFENLSQCAISMNNGVDWGEGFVSHDMLIQNNRFINNGYDATYFKDYNAAAIRLRVTKLKNPEAKGKWCGVATAPWQGLQNIFILNNSFVYNKRAISIECSKDVFIKGNTFIHNSEDPVSEFENVFEQNNSNLNIEN
ncbi:right-handed parallel beta-helix repeat-containing protein [Labilibacter sediminis]|nr:right-handed parallel beta-helix repeat-containing protein [Labilibacter sediminis]